MSKSANNYIDDNSIWLRLKNGKEVPRYLYKYKASLPNLSQEKLITLLNKPDIRYTELEENEKLWFEFIQLVCEEKIYLSDPRQFNDPFEFRPTKESFRKAFPKLPDEILNGIYKHNNYARNMGVFCFTSKNDNIPMWSHYASCHKGYCVIFNVKQMFENDNNPVGSTIQVDYQHTRDDLDLHGWKTNDEEYLRKFILTKAKHWEYENEYRCFKPCKNEKERIIALPKCSVKGIICGCKMDKFLREKFKKLGDEKQIAVYFAEISSDKYAIDIPGWNE